MQPPAPLPISSGSSSAYPKRPSYAAAASGSYRNSFTDRPGSSMNMGFSFTSAMIGSQGRSFKWTGGDMGSYGARFYGDGQYRDDSMPSAPVSTSITMDSGSYAATGMSFGFPSSMNRRMGSYQNPMSFSYGKGRSDADLSQTYECCNIKHANLHELLEHVEDTHPYTDPDDQDAAMGGMEMEMEDDTLSVTDAGQRTAVNSPSQSHAFPQPQAIMRRKSGENDVAMATSFTQLQLSDVLTSPPNVGSGTSGSGSGFEIAAASSGRGGPSSSSSGSSPPLQTPGPSQNPSPTFAAPRITPLSRNAFTGGNNTDLLRTQAREKRFKRGFNTAVTDELVDDGDDAELVNESADEGDEVEIDFAKEAKENAQAATPAGLAALANQKQMNGNHQEKVKLPKAVAPGVLFAQQVGALGLPTGPQALLPPAAAAAATQVSPVQAKETPVAAAATDPNEPPLPAPSLFATHKPWRCPKPGCNKSYKQSNGLKYHQSKGVCDFQIHDAVEWQGLTEQEAEERSRPFLCAVGSGCTKRYRQMNGLKYHYLNSGAHGEYGLRLIAQGLHPHPASLPPPKTKPAPTYTPPTHYQQPSLANRPVNGLPRPGGPTAQIQQGQTGPRMGTWPAQQPQNRFGAPNTGVRPGQLTSQPQQQQPRASPLLPVQRGREAVLFAAGPSGSDAMDV